MALRDCAPAPWRNGGGTTRELLRWGTRNAADATSSPGGADHWLLRVSVAEIERDGPFSALPGIERWFAVLQGAGVKLVLADGEHTLAAGAPPLPFAGEVAPGCWLVDGATRDLNLMSRRGHGQASMARIEAGQRIVGPAAWRALYAHEPARISMAGNTLDLEAQTLLWTDDASAEEAAVLEAGLAYLMTWQP